MTQAAKVTSVQKAGKVLAEIQIRRRAKGIEIKIVAPEFEEFFKDLSDGLVRKGTTNGFKDIELYIVDAANGLYSDSDGVINNFDCGLFDGTKANASFFRAKGIGSPEGVKFLIPGVISSEKLTEWKGKVMLYLKSFYKKHMKPFNVTCRLISEEI